MRGQPRLRPPRASPYWAVGSLCLSSFDGYSGEIELKVDGEEWTVNLKYQKGGIAPRPTDDVGGDRLYEYRIGAYGDGERKANFLIQPRFPNMRHYESGEEISNPFDNADPDEAVNVSFGGSNLEPEEYRDLLPEFVQALAREAGEFMNPDYFAGQPHEFSNITTYERYVRVTRNMGKKMVRRTGVMHRLLTLCATERGSKFEYRVDNEKIVGKNHRAIIPKADAKRLIGEHNLGKQLKHYHPRHVRDNDEKEDGEPPDVPHRVERDRDCGDERREHVQDDRQEHDDRLGVRVVLGRVLVGEPAEDEYPHRDDEDERNLGAVGAVQRIREGEVQRFRELEGTDRADRKRGEYEDGREYGVCKVNTVFPPDAGGNVLLWDCECHTVRRPAIPPPVKLRILVLL